MREIKYDTVVDGVRELCMNAATHLPSDVAAGLEAALAREESETGREVLRQLVENARIARCDNLPICQDTGLVVLFVDLGEDAHVTGNLFEALQEGVRRGYKDGYLRKSVVRSPIDRVNTGDNTPAVVHYDLVPGDRIRIRMLAKGGGSENMSRVHMLKPADGIEGVRRAVIATVEQAGANPCPPIVVGIGLGGTMEKAAMLAKRALLRKVGSANPDPALDALEKELLTGINELGIGPAGFGGRVTALAVFVDVHPCHIASLPLAVNLECHAHRHAEITL